MTEALDRATVVGGHGFIGTALAAHLRNGGTDVVIPGRDARPGKAAGHVFYCAGITADFRTRLHDTMTAHVALAQDWLAESDFQSFTYLSSTRIYNGRTSGREDAPLTVEPSNPSDLYNISKLAGEALVLTDDRPTARVVRLSNIFGIADGSDNFLTSIVDDAFSRGRVHVEAGAGSAKDYLALDDAVRAIAETPRRARSRVLNVASGVNTDNATIGRLIAGLTKAHVTFGADTGLKFPSIDIARMRSELGVNPEDFAPAFARMLEAMR